MAAEVCHNDAQAKINHGLQGHKTPERDVVSLFACRQTVCHKNKTYHATNQLPASCRDTPNDRAAHFEAVEEPLSSFHFQYTPYSGLPF